jgi:SAM-dependent methyltransferase
MNAQSTENSPRPVNPPAREPGAPDSLQAPDHSSLRIFRPEVEILLDSSPTPRERQQMDRWDELAETQAERTKGNNRQTGVHEKQQSLLDRFPHLGTSAAVILDFGAGIGCATDLFREGGATVVALEPSPVMAELTKGLSAPYARVIRYSATGNRELSELPNPIESGTVDCIVCYGAFQNFPSKGEAIGEFDEGTAFKVLERMHKLLKPGGVLSIQYLPPQPPVVFHESTTEMDPERFLELVTKAGFKVDTNKLVYACHHDKLKVDVYYQFLEATKA